MLPWHHRILIKIVPTAVQFLKMSNGTMVVCVASKRNSFSATNVHPIFIRTAQHYHDKSKLQTNWCLPLPLRHGNPRTNGSACRNANVNISPGQYVSLPTGFLSPKIDAVGGAFPFPVTYARTARDIRDIELGNPKRDVRSLFAKATLLPAYNTAG